MAVFLFQLGPLLALSGIRLNRFEAYLGFHMSITTTVRYVRNAGLAVIPVTNGALGRINSLPCI